MVMEHGLALLILIVVLPLITVKMRTTLHDRLLQLVFLSLALFIGAFGLVLISLEYLRKLFNRKYYIVGLVLLALSI